MPDLEPIGIVNTPFSANHQMPRQGSPATVTLYPRFAPGLDGIERSTHLWVLGWFEGATRSLSVRGRNAPPDAPARGVFAMRSPSRPNPIALSAARLIRRDGLVLHLDRLDFRDGTPVLDLKPYSPGWDLIPSASSGHSYDPSRYTRDELGEALARDACNALGPSAMDRPPVAALVQTLLNLAFDHGVELRSPAWSFELDSPDERLYVLLCATGATLDNGRIKLRPGCSLRAVRRAP